MAGPSRTKGLVYVCVYNNCSVRRQREEGVENVEKGLMNHHLTAYYTVYLPEVGMRWTALLFINIGRHYVETFSAFFRQNLLQVITLDR